MNTKSLLKSVAGFLLPYKLYLYVGKKVVPAQPEVIDEFDLADAVIALLNKTHPQVRAYMLDIGARMGLIDHGYSKLIQLGNLHVEGIEPDRAEAERLMAHPEFGRYVAVHPVAVYDSEGSQDIYLTSLKGCSSIKRPSVESFQRLTCSSWFEVVGKTQVDVIPLSKLYKNNERFDFIKIDVQGAEFEVIKGGDDIFANAIGITIEVQFQQLYEDQALFPEVHDWMLKNNFKLVYIDEHSNFYNGEVIEADCAYIKSPDFIDSKDTFLKHVLFAALNKNANYIELLVRCYGDNFLTAGEKAEMLTALRIELKRDKLKLLGPHN